MAKKPRRSKPADLPMFASATVLPQETTDVYGHDPKDISRVGRALVLTAARACNMNATRLACSPLRLYRKSGRAGAKLYRGRAVRDRKELGYLRGERRQLPGVKAVGYAADARELEEVLDHPILDLMRRPDPFLTGAEFNYLRFWYKEAVGRVYYYTGERAGGEPVSLYTMMPQYTRPVFSDTTIIREYRYGRNLTESEVFSADEVIYMRMMASPWSLLQASTWVDGVAQQLDLEAAAVTAELCRWKVGGSPGLVFQLPPTLTNTEQRTQVVNGINSQIRGVFKTGGFLFLQNVELKQAAMTKPHEMEYVEGMNEVERRVYAAADIPEALYKLNDANLASATVAMNQWCEIALLPRLTRDAEDLTEMLLPLFGVTPGEMWFAYDNPVKEDEQAEHVRLKDLVLAGAADVNEWRKVNHLPPIEGEDGLRRVNGETVGGEEDDGEEAPAVDAETVRLLAELVKQATAGELPADAAAALGAMAAPGMDVSAVFAGVEAERAKKEQAARDIAAGSGADAGTSGGNQEPGDGDSGPNDAGGTGEPAEPAAETKALAHALPGPDGAGDGHTCVGCGTPELIWKTYQPPAAMEAAQQSFAAQLDGWYRRAVGQIDTVNGRVNLDGIMPELNAIIQRNLSELVRLGAGEAMGLMGSEARDVDMSRPIVSAYVNERGLELSRTLPESLRREMASRIADGMAQGQSLNQIQASLMQAAPEISAEKAEVVARTETARASGYGTDVALDQAGFSTKKWMTAGGPCPMCDALDGMTAPVGGYFIEPGGSIVGTDGKVYDFPTGVQTQGETHPNCVLPGTKVLTGGVLAATRAYYSGPVFEVRTRLGHFASVTANHQMLTSAGWVAAHALRVGGDLVCALGGDAAKDPDVYNKQAAIEQVFEAACVASGVTRVGVPAAPEHLHGDGVFADGEIDVVAAEGSLGSATDPALFEQLCEKALVCGDVGAAEFACGGDPNAMLLALRLAADGIVGGSREALSLFRGGAGHADEHRVALAALAYPGGLEVADNNGPADAEALRDCLDSLAANGVAVDEIVEIRKIDFRGHVYDLTTVSGAYICNGMVAHNCRCAVTMADATEGEDNGT